MAAPHEGEGRHRDQNPAARLQLSRQIGKRALAVVEMLEHVEHGDEVVGAVLDARQIR